MTRTLPNSGFFENFHLVHITPPLGGADKKAAVTSRLRTYRVDLGRVVVADGGGCVEQHGQQVLLHVADLGGVVVQALHDELDVGAVQLKNRDLTTSWGKSAPAIRVVLRLAQTVSTISSTISSKSSR